MPDNVFPYPGGKSKYADWIISYFPKHSSYIEPFGGSGAVLLNKQRSKQEVFNDLNGDIIQFFETVRDSTEELIKWVENTPYSRELYERYSEDYRSGERPDDPIERAGRFFYLRYAQFGGQLEGKQSFRVTRNPDARGGYIPRDINSKARNLSEVAARFSEVVIESAGYVDVVERYDYENAFFYFDPPYVDVGDNYYSHEGEFDHEEFVSVLSEIAGRWVVSYGELPSGLDGYHIASREQRYSLNLRDGVEQDRKTERLVMNFDPEQTPSFSAPEQATLAEAGQ